MSVIVRRVQAEEWSVLKSIRLTALHDAPYAFSTRYEDAILRPDDQWQEMAARSAVSDTTSTFLAFNDAGEVVGMAGGYRDDLQADYVHLVAVWVAPDWRSQGVAFPLTDAVAQWAASLPVPRLLAYVTEGNDRAIRFYEKAGFDREPEEVARPGAHARCSDILLVKYLLLQES